MKQGHFLEISEVDGDLYGTTVDSVVRLMESGRICVLRIDLEGVQQLKSSAITPVPARPPTRLQLESWRKDFRSTHSSIHP